MEHERREDSNEQPVAARTEPDYREESVIREPEDQRPAEPDYPREEGASSGEYREPEARPEYSSGDNPEPDSERGSQSSSQGAPRGRGRGRGRGGRRSSARDRRIQDRGRRRDNRPPFHASGQDSGRSQEDFRDRDQRPESQLPPETRTLLEQAREELDQVREVLEGVLKDLDHVAEQLNKAEHEKDIAEAEIEQLRESLRRLHR